MEIITSDGKRIGYLGPLTRPGILQVARSPHQIPWGWIARVDSDVILRRTYAQVVAEWGAEPGPVVIAGGKR
jgi:sporulation protein YlmC with PRC-barrel domain